MPNRNFFDENIQRLRESGKTLDQLLSPSGYAGLPPLLTSDERFEKIRSLAPNTRRQVEALQEYARERNIEFNKINYAHSARIDALKDEYRIKRDIDRLRQHEIIQLEKAGKTEEANKKRAIAGYSYELTKIRELIIYERRLAAERNQTFRQHAQFTNEQLRAGRLEMEQRRKSLPYALLAQPHAPGRVIREYSLAKIQRHVNRLADAGGLAGLAKEPGGFGGAIGEIGGGILGGALGFMAGFALDKLISVVKQGVVRAYRIGIQEANVAVTGAAAGQTTGQFISGVTQNLGGLAISPEERAQLVAGLLPIMGQLPGQGNFEGVLRTGAAFARGFGIQPGEGVNFFGQMTRFSNVAQSTAGSQVFAEKIADAIGEGRLAGLQEEMLTGISQLVDLTRHEVVNGPDAAMFARLISNMSDIGARNLRGADAARAIAGISNAMAHPGTPVGQALSIMALRRTLAQAGFAGVANTNPAELLFLQQQGVGATFRGRPIGMQFMGNFVDLIRRWTGNNPALGALILNEQSHIGIGTAQAILQNSDQIFNRNSILNRAFGMGAFGTSPLGLNFESKVAYRLSTRQSPLDALRGALHDMADIFTANGVMGRAQSAINTANNPAAAAAALAPIIEKLQLPTPQLQLQNTMTTLDQAIVTLGTKILSLTNVLQALLTNIKMVTNDAKKVGEIGRFIANPTDPMAWLPIIKTAFSPSAANANPQIVAPSLKNNPILKNILEFEGNGGVPEIHAGFTNFGFNNFSSLIDPSGRRTGGLYDFLGHVQRAGHAGNMAGLVEQILTGEKFLTERTRPGFDIMGFNAGLSSQQLASISGLEAAGNPYQFFQQNFIDANKDKINSLVNSNLPIAESMLLDDAKNINRLFHLRPSDIAETTFLETLNNFNPALTSRARRIVSAVNAGHIANSHVSGRNDVTAIASELAKENPKFAEQIYSALRLTLKNATNASPADISSLLNSFKIEINLHVDNSGHLTATTSNGNVVVRQTSAARASSYSTQPYPVIGR